jgi:ubiquinone/menaquinone biosynthesis C-methylase UbiE
MVTLRNGATASVRSTERVSELWPAEDLESVNHCPLCGCTDRVELHRDLTDRVFCAPGRWSLYQCRCCEGAYLDPRPTLESIARAYSLYYTHDSQLSGGDERPNAFVRLKRAMYNGYLNANYNFDESPAITWGRWTVAALPPIRLKRDSAARHLRLKRRGARLLDIGCGNGAFVNAARAWGWDAEGLEPDPNAVAVGRAKGLPITAGSLPRTVYPDASFAAVTMSHSIEHLHDPVACLREVHRILQPGGTVWIDTPNLSSSGHDMFGADWRGLEPPRHLVLFTMSSLSATLRRVGFDQIRQVRAPFISRWYFTSSLRIARNEDPPPMSGSRLPQWLRLRAVVADWWAFLHPTCGEQIIVMARSPL